jgi:hypothetical protein
MTDMNKRDFRIVAGKGFALDLPNGVTVSVQWGPGNYVDSDVKNADWDAPGKTAAAGEVWGSNLAECAAYLTAKDSDGAWVAVPGYTGTPEGADPDDFYDDVVGHLNVEQVLDFINEAGKLVILVEEDPMPSDQYPVLPGQQEFDFNDAR